MLDFVIRCNRTFAAATMAHIADIGKRVELVSMDPHFHDISIALYEQHSEDGRPEYTLHTYSSRDGARERVGFAAEAMKTLGGMRISESGSQLVCFPCGQAHERACKRVFLEACKIEPGTVLEARPLSIYDKKSKGTIRIYGTGAGEYRVTAEDQGPGMGERLSVVTRGLMKLGDMQAAGDGDFCVAFDCGHAHDALVGLLLVRAPNVRAALREQESAAARGTLVAPSAQKA